MSIKERIIRNTLLGLVIICFLILITELILIYIKSDHFFKSKVLANCPHSSSLGNVKEKVYTLVRLENDKCIPMFSYKGKDTIVPAIQWKNMLFLGSPTYADNVRVFALNTVSNSIKTLFDSSQLYYESKQSKPYQLLDFRIKDDVLYFSPSGSADNSYYSDIYYLDLPLQANSNAIKLTDLPTNDEDVRQIGSHLFFVSSADDKCKENYSFFNPSTKTIEKSIISFTKDTPSCLHGEKLIAVDNSSNFIVATVISFRSLKPYLGHPQAYDPKYDYTIYNSLSLVPITNISKKVFLLTTRTMPRDILWIFYSKEKNKLFLSGKDLYEYDLQSKGLTKIINLTSDPEEYFSIIYTSGDNICVQGDTNIHGNMQSILFNTKTKKVVKSTKTNYCFEQDDHKVQQSQGFNSEMVRNLLLPPNYAIIITPP